MRNLKSKISNPPDRQPSPYALKHLKPALKPFRFHYFPRLRSTNDHAARLRRAGKLYAPAVVLTSKQIAGRGRGSNTWWSNPGVLTVTFAVPIHERLVPHELPLIAGLSVRNAAAELTGDTSIGLKWPNDLLHDDRKLAGLLCERTSNVDLVGIGLNVNVDPADAPKSLQNQITSLLAIAGKPLDMTDVLISVAKHLHHNIRRRLELPFSAFVREYSRHDALAGKTVSLAAGNEPVVTGRCEGIDNNGRLLIRQRGKVIPIVAGMVTILSRS
jgi:BirA family biotin operon repressor/biotin-[acetyl-CoA-carboxylase] ligase